MVENMARLSAVLCVFLCGLCVSRAVHCNVKDYGAKGDGKNNDTDPFIKAFQACTDKGIYTRSRDCTQAWLTH